MKLDEIKSKLPNVNMAEYINVIVNGKMYPATCSGVSLNKDFDAVVTYTATVPERKPRTPKTEVKPLGKK